MEKPKVYTLSQVAQHNSKNDIWLTINGKVMDVSKFIEEHPGGEEVLREYGGKDASKGFERVGHTKEAYNLLSKYEVGYLQGYKTTISQPDDEQDEQSSKGKEMEAYIVKDDPGPNHMLLIEFVVPVLVAGAYFSYRCMTGAAHSGS